MISIMENFLTVKLCLIYNNQYIAIYYWKLFKNRHFKIFSIG